MRKLGALLCLIGLVGCGSQPDALSRRIGVMYVVHGGFTEYAPRYLWDGSLQIFAYDPNSVLYQRVLWNPDAWPRLLQFGNAPKELGKYAFEYERQGGRDPFWPLTLAQLQDMGAALEAAQGSLGVQFVIDYAAWITDDPTHHAHPRLIYEPKVAGGEPMTYCGSRFDGGTGPGEQWSDCDPERYNVDGTVDRLLAAGVTEIILIDTTTAGVRFAKTFDVVRLTRQVVAAHNAATGSAVTVHWVNDPTDLMRESFPAEPAGWTRSLGRPVRDRSVPLAGRPNPVSDDPRLAALHARGISSRFRAAVPLADTGVLLVNHAINPFNEYFDPKINDTVVLNRNIKQLLLAEHAQLQAEHVLGAWMGVKEPSAHLSPDRSGVPAAERTRKMRGENLGDARLYETDQLPTGEWGYRYWEALDELRAAGVKHIVVAFPQILTDSVLNLVELPNQIAKELGYRNWAGMADLDLETYPEVGHPFADYWGIWVDRTCVGDAVEQPCCFTMGGCPDGRPYPPPRQTPVDQPREDLDPSLAFDVSEFGHLGYRAAAGPVDPNRPVQDQYTGTWAIWQPPNDDPEVGRWLADRLLAFLSDRARQAETSEDSR